jgi:hypothetical protein
MLKPTTRIGIAAIMATLSVSSPAVAAEGRTPGAKFSGSSWGNVPNVGDRNVAPSGGGGGAIRPPRGDGGGTNYNGGGGGRPNRGGGGYAGGGNNHFDGGERYRRHRYSSYYSYSAPVYYDNYYVENDDDGDCRIYWRRYQATGNPKWRYRYRQCIE